MWILLVIGLLGLALVVGFVFLSATRPVAEDTRKREKNTGPISRRDALRKKYSQNTRVDEDASWDEDEDEDEDVDEDEDEDDSDLDAPRGDSSLRRRIGKKRAEKIRQREQKRSSLEALKQKREEENQLYKERRQREEEEEQLLDDEEERQDQERREREEKELAEWSGMFEVVSAGSRAADTPNATFRVADFISYIQSRKVVELDRLAAKFDLSVKNVMDRIRSLEENGDLTGIVDDRGKYIYIPRSEMEQVCDFIKEKGRVSISELSRMSNRLIRLDPDEKDDDDDLVLNNTASASTPPSAS